MAKKITKKVTKNTTLENILKIKGAEKVLMKHNLPCLSCPMAAMEISGLKLGEVCEAYGLDLEKILKELNK
jgi:hybrid cluster-associated redox disulfide protein